MVTSRQITVLVVDDSMLMRKALTMMLESDPSIKVIGTARNGEEGVEMAASLKPDLVTMDIEMPKMDGLAALRQIMVSDPIPVIMISSLTSDGASATLDALELGAVDFITKHNATGTEGVRMKEDLLRKIRDIGCRRKIILVNLRRQGARIRRQAEQDMAQRPLLDRSIGDGETRVAGKKRHHKVNLISIGSSTGGPPILKSIITQLPGNLPVGIVIAQHMPPTFTKSMADRLNGLSQLTVKEAEHGEAIEPGIVYVGPGGQHVTVRLHGRRGRIAVSDEPAGALYKPSVDILMNSAARHYETGALALILTGMGKDGLEGIRAIKARGGVILAQDEQSCVVYGMPKAVVDAGLADYIAPGEQMATEIASFF